MINNIFKKLNWMVLLTAGILFFLLAASPIFADYSGHVASFKNEDNAIKFVDKMKAKGIVAYYQKENILGKGDFYRTYIGRYKTIPLAKKALTKLQKAGEIEFFKIQKAAEVSTEVAVNKTETVAQKEEPAQKPESKTEAVAQKEEPAQKPESKTEPVAQKEEQAQKPESGTETVAQKEEPAQKPESGTETVAQKEEPAQKPESKTEPVAQKEEPVQKPEKKTTPSIYTQRCYAGIKGIVLKNGKVIRGQIISIDDNDVLKIRTKKGKILSYSFINDVKKYITEYEP